EHDDAVIAVSVSHERFVRRRMDPYIGGAMHVLGVCVSATAVALPDLQQELAVGVELQDLIVSDRLQPGDAIGRAVVASNPDAAFRVDVNAMLSLGPLVAGAGAAPRLYEVAGAVEHDHRRSG